MSVLAEIRLIALAGWALLCALTLGPALVLSALVALRDRRRSRLAGAVRDRLASAGGRQPLDVRVRCALLSRRSVVTLNLRGHSREDAWKAVEGLSRRLPRHVRLVLEGIGDDRQPLGAEVGARDRDGRPPQPLAA